MHVSKYYILRDLLDKGHNEYDSGSYISFTVGYRGRVYRTYAPKDPPSSFLTSVTGDTLRVLNFLINKTSEVNHPIRIPLITGFNYQEIQDRIGEVVPMAMEEFYI